MDPSPLLDEDREGRSGYELDKALALGVKKSGIKGRARDVNKRPAQDRERHALRMLVGRMKPAHRSEDLADYRGIRPTLTRCKHALGVLMNIRELGDPELAENVVDLFDRRAVSPRRRGLISPRRCRPDGRARVCRTQCRRRVGKTHGARVGALAAHGALDGRAAPKAV
jgi:hypothetical protein